jgi:hypothetical protein
LAGSILLQIVFSEQEICFRTAKGKAEQVCFLHPEKRSDEGAIPTHAFWEAVGVPRLRLGMSNEWRSGQK